MRAGSAEVVTAGVYRAPMRSRRDDIDHNLAIARALAQQTCGFGGALSPPPQNLDDAMGLAGRQHDSRLTRRIARFADVPAGSFVWTRDADGLFWLGQITGPWKYDASSAAADVDLVHIRPCRWSRSPVVEHKAPNAVIATFARGGRNFQQIHDRSVTSDTARIWADHGR